LTGAKRSRRSGVGARVTTCLGRCRPRVATSSSANSARSFGTSERRLCGGRSYSPSSMWRGEIDGVEGARPRVLLGGEFGGCLPEPVAAGGKEDGGGGDGLATDSAIGLVLLDTRVPWRKEGLAGGVPRMGIRAANSWIWSWAALNSSCRRIVVAFCVAAQPET
jgi:hypothetical protein